MRNDDSDSTGTGSSQENNDTLIIRSTAARMVRPALTHPLHSLTDQALSAVGSGHTAKPSG